MISTTPGRRSKAAAAAARFFATARMSTSPTVSRIRRNEPAASMRSTVLLAFIPSVIASTTRAASTRKARAWPSLTRSIARTRFSSVFSPNPLTRRRRCFSAAAFNVSRSVIPSCCQRILTFFGPRPRTRSRSRTPGGNFARSSSWYGIRPVVTYSVIFSAKAGPMPGIWSTRPDFTRSSTFSVSDSSCRAARWYDRTRNVSSPRMSSMSAISLNRAAISSFFTSGGDVPRPSLWFLGAFLRTVIWTGTCGFGRRQAEVMQHLDAVEIQETFYRPVSVERALKWRGLAPPDFRFCVKASQFITHEATSPTYRRSGRIVADSEKSNYGSFQDTPQVLEGWEATRAIADADLGRLRAICREYDDAYVMFNNLSMHADALRFRLGLRDPADSSAAVRE